MKALLRLLPIVVLIVVLLAFVTTARANVTLVSFTAVAQTGQILVQWVTASELNNAGFNLHRSLSPDGPFQNISGFIVTESDGFSETHYDYPDTSAILGNTYYYKLESVDTSGNSEFTAPIFAVYGTQVAASTATATATRTRTPTPTTTATIPAGNPTNTATATSPLNSPTPTSSATATATSATFTQTPTSTATGVPGQPTPSRTATRTATIAGSTPNISPSPTTGTSTAAATSATATDSTPQGPTRTATLIPLPSLTLIFPAYSPTLSPTVAPSATPTATHLPTATPTLVGPGGVPSRIYTLIGAAALLWILLGGFLLFFLRRMTR